MSRNWPPWGGAAPFRAIEGLGAKASPQRNPLQVRLCGRKGSGSGRTRMEDPPLPVWEQHCYCTSEVGKLNLRAAIGPHVEG